MIKQFETYNKKNKKRFENLLKSEKTSEDAKSSKQQIRLTWKFEAKIAIYIIIFLILFFVIRTKNIIASD